MATRPESKSITAQTVWPGVESINITVGTPLLEPVGRRVRLTAEAEILVEHTERILRALEEAQADIARARESVRGRVRVATFQTAAHTVIPDAMRALAQAHPDLQVHVTHLGVEGALPGLIARDFDLVLRETFPGEAPTKLEGVETVAAADDPLWLLAPAGDPVASLEAASERPWVMEPAGTPARRWTTAVCRRAGFEPRVLYESCDVLWHIRLVATGVAVALTPALPLLAADTAGVAAIRLPDAPARTISTAVRHGSGHAPAIAAVRAAIAEQLTRHVARAERLALSV
jgi:DNA-binding transcriptional LysR family regulator